MGLEQSAWEARWREGRIGFHQPRVSDFLEKYADAVWGSAPALKRAFVPLCGKSLDLVYLAERAASVVGVEYVEQAVIEFFSEHEVAPERSNGVPVSYSHGKYTIFAADFFKLARKHIGTIDAVFDRASLVALDAETRARYAAHLGTLVPGGVQVLLVTFDYDQAEMDGPPFAVSASEVQTLFASQFLIEHLETRDVLEDAPKFRQRGLTAMRESAFCMTRKPDSPNQD